MLVIWKRMTSDFKLAKILLTFFTKSDILFCIDPPTFCWMTIWICENLIFLTVGSMKGWKTKNCFKYWWQIELSDLQFVVFQIMLHGTFTLVFPLHGCAYNVWWDTLYFAVFNIDHMKKIFVKSFVWSI